MSGLPESASAAVEGEGSASTVEGVEHTPSAYDDLKHGQAAEPEAEPPSGVVEPR